MTNTVVLILGRFTPERKAVLDAIRDELRKRDYTAILFDFQTPPANRDWLETVSFLAHLSYFVVADMTDARSVMQELHIIVPHLPSVPVVPIVQHGREEPAVFSVIEKFPWVLDTFHYKSIADVVSHIPDKNMLLLKPG
jgi:hypothetical protein